MKHFLLACLAVITLASCSSALQNGVQIQLEEGALQVEFITPDIVRAQYSANGSFTSNGTIVCLPRQKQNLHIGKKQLGNIVVLSSDSMQVQIDEVSGKIAYLTLDGQQLLATHEDGFKAEKTWQIETLYDEASKHTVQTADGEKVVMDVLRQDTIGQAWKYRIAFEMSPEHALYGLGSHMEDYLNLRGKRLGLIQHNLKATVPVLNSTGGYGLLFDAGCGMIFDDTTSRCQMELEAAQTLDYYFMKGQNLDATVAQYRKLTGGVPMQPKYIFGYIQSKERYQNAAEVQRVVERYREQHIPLDVIVQDWMYWPQGWGYIHLDTLRYPDATAWADTIHKMNAHLMVSIWPNPSGCPEADDFSSHGWYLGGTAYDAYNADARQLYWKYANETFFSHGIDAWWCDCTEPIDADWHMMPQGYGWDSHEERYRSSVDALSKLLGAERANTFSLFHSQGIYENQRAQTKAKRVVNLTRSSYAGQQRFATITWNGDTHASWQGFARMIPAGLNFMATGCNYWTVDAGAFFTIKTPIWFYGGSFGWNAANKGYHEFYLRMLQYAQFLPLFRSHGTNIPREIWNFGEPGDPIYEGVLHCIERRYEWLPYIYSLSHQVTANNYTMARLLAFDFANDENVLDIKDEYMFGPSVLVKPVTHPICYDEQGNTLKEPNTHEQVYLPAGARWIDFWSGATYEGSQMVSVEATLDHLPLFIKAGSIIPQGAIVEYAALQDTHPLQIHVYPGADAAFTLYDDSGDGYDYEKGAYATTQLLWDDASHTLVLGKREGSFAQMQAERPMQVVLHCGSETVCKELLYKGEELRVKL